MPITTPLPILQPKKLFEGKDYREVLRREMDAGKIPISLGKTCPVKCEFCYELDHSYRETLEPPKTTQEDWQFILDYVKSKHTDKNLTFFTVGFVHVPKIHQLVAQYPGRINFELSVITLGRYRQKLMPHAPAVKHLMKVLDGPAVSSANFYAFDRRTMSNDAMEISKVNQKCVLWMGCLTPVR